MFFVGGNDDMKEDSFVWHVSVKAKPIGSEELDRHLESTGIFSDFISLNQICQMPDIIEEQCKLGKQCKLGYCTCSTQPFMCPVSDFTAGMSHELEAKMIHHVLEQLSVNSTGILTTE